MSLFRDDRRVQPEPARPDGHRSDVVAWHGGAGSEPGGAEPAAAVSEASDEAVAAALSEVDAVSPAAAAATADALATAGRAVAIANSNAGENTAIKIVNHLQESLERFDADGDYLAAVLELFAPPAGFGNRVAEWMDSHLMVVALDQDRGRFITAHASLATIHKERGVKVGALSFGGGSTFPVRQLPPHRDRAYVVEVPAEEAEFKLHSTFGSSLRALQERLRNQSCWMVMVMSVEQWNRAEAQVPGLVTIRDGRVDPQEIARRALRVRDSQIPVEQWLADRRVARLITGQIPAEVQEIVELIVAAQQMPESALEDDGARKTDRGAEGGLVRGDDWLFNKRVEVVVEARLNWHKRLLEWHRAQGRTGIERNFLISAAVQKGAPVAYVYTGATDLGQALGEKHRRRTPTGQDVPGVIDLVDAVEADLANDGTVVFDRVGWDDAALQYFWVDRPLSRKLFLDWLAERAVQSHKHEALESLTEVQRRALAGRISQLAVDWAVRQGRAQPLTRIAEEWYDQGVVWSEFIDVLDHAAVQPSTARSIHPMLLTWANASPGSKQPCKLAVAEICSRQFGRKYTGKALIRLKHAANSDDVRVVGAVKEAVQTLWDDETVRHALFAAVIGWCGDDKTAAAGRQSFCTLALMSPPVDSRQPSLLIEPVEREEPAPTVEDLSRGWRSLLAPGNSDDHLEEVLPFWLEAAVAFPEHRGRIADILCRAVRGPEIAGEESPRNRLTGLVRQWSKRPSAEVEQREQLYTLITGKVDDDFMASHGAASGSSA
ncbi:hypothetical protein AB0J40_08175 [Amycolatopsis sp. NPDC049691]|uniref:hypothetical protein n=1 Tax=Amycolatopsis sp. NPDC049691 TaxID=3155155 RepID=UPI003438C28E